MSAGHVLTRASRLKPGSYLMRTVRAPFSWSLDRVLIHASPLLFGTSRGSHRSKWLYTAVRLLCFGMAESFLVATVVDVRA